MAQGGLLYLFGGIGEKGLAAPDAALVYDPDVDVWLVGCRPEAAQRIASRGSRRANRRSSLVKSGGVGGGDFSSSKRGGTNPMEMLDE